MTPTIYLFSGLGADKRVFQELQFKNNPVVHIDWLEPEKNETIESYAKRLQLQINADNGIYVGLSFGGVLAIEIAKNRPPQQLILVSSLKTKHELPWYFRIIGKLKINQLIPAKWMKQNTRLSRWFFGISAPQDAALFQAILKDTSPTMLAWAIDVLLNWQNTDVPKNVTHLHGTSDRLLPVRFIQNHHAVPDGGHWMISNKHIIIQENIEAILQRNKSD